MSFTAILCTRLLQPWISDLALDLAILAPNVTNQELFESCIQYTDKRILYYEKIELKAPKRTEYCSLKSHRFVIFDTNLALFWDKSDNFANPATSVTYQGW